MQLSDISLLGVAIVVVMMACCGGLFIMLDKRMASRMGRVLIYYTLSLVVACLYIMGLFKVGQWWASLLWSLPLVAVTALLTLRKAHVPAKKLYWYVALSEFLAMIIGCGIITLTLPVESHVAIIVSQALLAGMMIKSVSSAIRSYTGSLANTQEHIQYMLANGANHNEAIMPSVKRALRGAVVPLLYRMTRPVAMALPLFLCGLLLGGVSPIVAVVVVMVATCVSFACCLLTVIICLVTFDKVLFDRSGKYIG